MKKLIFSVQLCLIISSLFVCQAQSADPTAKLGDYILQDTPSFIIATYEPAAGMNVKFDREGKNLNLLRNTKKNVRFGNKIMSADEFMLHATGLSLDYEVTMEQAPKIIEEHFAAPQEQQKKPSCCSGK